MFSLLWAFVGSLALFCPCSETKPPLHEFSSGDIIIGGLFALHKKTNRNFMHGPTSCHEFDIDSFMDIQVMIWAIREINQRTPRLLPNLTLGYDIYDTCGDASFAIRGALEMLKGEQPGSQSCSAYDFPADLPEPRTKAVIGERSSEISIAVARILALSSVTQISYLSTSELLSKKLKFPTFLRTISSDKYQTKAIAELARKFNWRTVAIIGSDDEYGKYGSDNLQRNLEMRDICIEFLQILPGYFSSNVTEAQELLDRLVTKINESSAEAIIMFTYGTYVKEILREAVKHNLNRTWVASDSWSTSKHIVELPGIQRAGEVFGFISKRNEVPGFKDYIRSKFNGTNNVFLDYYMTLCSNLSQVVRNNNDSLTSFPDLDSLAEALNQDESYNTYLALQVIIEGLRHLLKCDNRRCERNTNFTTFELLEEIKKVNFTVNTTHIFFDEFGDPRIGYDILYWDLTEPRVEKRIQCVGEYGTDGRIVVADRFITERQNVTVTVYNCSKTCEAGYELKQQSGKCCTGCFQCNDGLFSAGNGTSCQVCGTSRYSSPQRHTCLNKTLEVLNWFDPFVIILSSLEVLGIIVTVVFAILFTIHHNTPIVKAVGGGLVLLELLALLVCFSLTFSYPGQPSGLSCLLGLPVFSMAFSLCISCILANLLQIFVGFSFETGTGSWVKKLHKPWAVVTLLFGMQLGLCLHWMYFYPPSPKRKELTISILLQCRKGSAHLCITTIAYNALLAIICFLFAFKGRKLPDLYKNASLITNSMMLYLVMWILLIPLYINLYGKYQPAIEVVAILISSYSVLCCHLAPKCYIMVFRKELNNQQAITEYIRKHYEQRNIPVVRS